MSCYFMKMTKILYSNLELILDFCDAAALILSTVFYLLKPVALSFVGTSCRMITELLIQLCRW